MYYCRQWRYIMTKENENGEKWIDEIQEGLNLFMEDEDPDKNFLIPWLKKVEILEAEKTSKTTSRIVYRFPVLKEYLNPTRTFHGGAIASIMDVCTTWCLFLICDYGFWSTMGTTRSLHCVYLKPAMEDDVLLCECRIVHAGKRLCLLSGSMTREKDGGMVATCEHNKYNVDADSSNM
ncbi:hypothetical protein AC579_1940 [Pseudocercospora musae]|uniref:Thioesterase domain-containing protein n=1 Tax=Pseudocercospora musae TaxID=113226 RepID=A0A139I7V4_9PEZI|nr:hypothetical protein AC579_1940 [Pseudocercospora musae]